ncbi:hypothetical protein QBC40DRAFT_320372 [Triangularia verruculosa]|uniref:Zn(2)-C6 fungal-type domain-containing protein n=1 Tax=Triangularia verruculosa TaxID=2587418 RepID=A0AAN6XXI7_9PEZI|nr:hypothetical protein QBC40DRAFT_320372 [Triangularia verruculosa]
MASTPTATRPATRSKREKYSSIACQACRKSKLKCKTTSVPGYGLGCGRCISQRLVCRITRPPRGLRSNALPSPAPASITATDKLQLARFQKMEEELSILRRQVSHLTSSFQQQNPVAPTHQSQSPRPPEEDETPFTVYQVNTRVEPQFVGTTRPTFTLNIAKASLQLMGVAVSEDNSEPQPAALSALRYNTCLLAATDLLLPQLLKVAITTALVLEESGKSNLGLNLFNSVDLLANFPNREDRDDALAVFWCVYALDRRWSLGTGLSFALVDRDVDPNLPELPPHMTYLKCLVDYARLCSKVWDTLPQFSAESMSPTTSGLLLAIELHHPTLSPSRGARNLRTMMYLRGNHLRSLVNRQHVLSTAAISSNLQQARLVVQITRNSIQVIITLSRQTDIYTRQQPAYNHYLVSALAIVLLATYHAPNLFTVACRKDFSDAVSLVRGFSEASIAGHRLWKSMCGLVSAVTELGLGYSQGERSQDNNGEDQQHTPPVPGPVEHVHGGMGDFHFDAGFYNLNTAAQPDMGHVGTDLMGLFDTFWHACTIHHLPSLS